MNKFLAELKEIQNFTTTENGAVAFTSTGNAMLDAFGSLGAMKDSSVESILKTFDLAFNENPEMAMKLLFYIRDVRGGQGMRRVFRVIITHLAYTHPELVVANLENILFFGRGDDYLCLLDTPVEKAVIEYIYRVVSDDLALIAHGQPCSLLGKWLPSENASSIETKRYANKLIKGLKLTPKQYRKMLTTLRRNIGIVETYMSRNEWDKIAFSKVPSRASMIYSDAFQKHCLDEYIQYLKDVAEGKATINAGALFPVDIIHRAWEYIYRLHDSKTLKDRYLLEGMWNALPNYFEGLEETGICVVDTSGSMYGTPIEVAISLGMYCADKCKGPFKNHFLTFSSKPHLQEIVGETIVDKVANMERAGWEMNTNLEAVFDLILRTAVDNNMKQEDIPSKLYIISDMQFDSCVKTDGYRNVVNETFMDTMEHKFAEHGYTLPAIVYWNVRQSSCGMFQKKFGDHNCCMVSGYSPSLFKAVIEGTDYVEEQKSDGTTVTKQVIDPMTIMERTLNNERYDRVVCK